MSEFKDYINSSFENLTLVEKDSEPDDTYRLDYQKECPNCRGKGRITREEFDDGDVWYRPECSCCKIGWQENYPTIKEAVEAWNGAGVMYIYTDPNWRPERNSFDKLMDETNLDFKKLT